jgi:hypothetical protein
MPCERDVVSGRPDGDLTSGEFFVAGGRYRRLVGRSISSGDRLGDQRIIDAYARQAAVF